MIRYDFPRRRHAGIADAFSVSAAHGFSGRNGVVCRYNRCYDSTPVNPLSRERQGQSEPVHSQCDGLIHKFWGNYLINNGFDGTLWNIRWNMMEHWDQMDAGYVIDARIDQHPAAIAVSGAGILSWQDRNLARIIATVATFGVKCDARVQNVTRHKSLGVAMGELDQRCLA